MPLLVRFIDVQVDSYSDLFEINIKDLWCILSFNIYWGNRGTKIGFLKVVKHRRYGIERVSYYIKNLTKWAFGEISE